MLHAFFVAFTMKSALWRLLSRRVIMICENFVTNDVFDAVDILRHVLLPLKHGDN